MQTRQELLIVSPYFVPGKEGVAWLRGLVARGVHVTVLTNSLAATDVGAVHSGYQRYRDALLEGGVVLYELKPGAVPLTKTDEKAKGYGSSRASLHAKTFVFDRSAVFIGSLNLDPRSMRLNTEIGVVCESAPLAENIAGALEKNLDSIAWRLERVVDASGKRAHRVGGDQRRGRATVYRRTRSQRHAPVLGVVPRTAADRVPTVTFNLARRPRLNDGDPWRYS